MSFDDPIGQAFLQLYVPLPRQGPGSASATRAVLELVPELPAAPRILDAGCGSGGSTLVLAQALPSASIVAVDVLDVLLERLATASKAAGFDARVDVRRESMLDVQEPPESIDLIWCEGAIYTFGIERALRTWRPLLGPGACVVFSDACWWQRERSPALVEFWAENYPDMRDEAEVLALFEPLGFTGVATRRLEREGWLTDYYEPLARRCDELRPHADPILAQVIANAKAEIASFAANQDQCGYTFFVAQRSPG
jgi:serine/threonine-protein kinase HipA